MPIYNFEVPTELEGVDTKILDPRDTYKDAAEWTKRATKLANMFTENFVKFTGNEEGKSLQSAGPRL